MVMGCMRAYIRPSFAGFVRWNRLWNSTRHSTEQHIVRWSPIPFVMPYGCRASNGAMMVCHHWATLNCPSVPFASNEWTKVLMECSPYSAIMRSMPTVLSNGAIQRVRYAVAFKHQSYPRAPYAWNAKAPRRCGSV